MRLYTEVKDAWEAILEDCRNAGEEILFEQFLISDFEEDSIGQELVEILEERASVGVKVRLLADLFGSPTLFTSKWQPRLEKAGVDIKFIYFRSPFALKIPLFRFRRDHRKLIVIDKKISYIGGVVFTDRAYDWHDLQGRFTKGSELFAEAFYRKWNNLESEDGYKTKVRDDCEFSLIANEPSNRSLYKDVSERIARAKKEITIVSPYISPHRRLTREIEEAARKGVRVRICTPEEADSKLTGWARDSYVKNFIKAGVEFYMFTPGMNHAKAIIIDDWGTFGSMNFDRLSFFHNDELNVVSNDPEFLESVSNVVNSFINDSERITEEEWQKQSFGQLLKRAIGYFWRPLL